MKHGWVIILLRVIMETDHSILLVNTCKNFSIFYLKKKRRKKKGEKRKIGNHENLDLNIKWVDITKDPKSNAVTPQTCDPSASDTEVWNHRSGYFQNKTKEHNKRCMELCLWRVSHWTIATDGCGPPCGWQDSNLGPLEDHSLQFNYIAILSVIYLASVS